MTQDAAWTFIMDWTVGGAYPLNVMTIRGL
jgi:hypothetical protein